MKKSIQLCCAAVLSVTASYANLPTEHNTHIEKKYTIEQKLRPISSSIDTSKLQSPQTPVTLQALFTQLLDQINTDQEIGFQSVLFQTTVNPKNRTINIGEFRYFQTNAFSAYLEELMQDVYQNNCIAVNGITIKVQDLNQDQKQEMAKTLAQKVYKIISQPAFNSDTQLTVSINFEYPTL